MKKGNGKVIVGLIMVVLGVAVGLYVGLWLCLIGGIVQIITAIQTGFPAMSIALGVVRILFAGAAGVLSAMLLIVPGLVMIKD